MDVDGVLSVTVIVEIVPLNRGEVSVTVGGIGGCIKGGGGEKS